MVLSSQQARPGTSRSYMFARRSARRNRSLAIAGVSCLALIGLYFILFGGGPDDPTGGVTPPTLTDDGTASSGAGGPDGSGMTLAGRDDYGSNDGDAGWMGTGNNDRSFRTPAQPASDRGRGAGDHRRSGSNASEYQRDGSGPRSLEMGRSLDEETQQNTSRDDAEASERSSSSSGSARNTTGDSGSSSSSSSSASPAVVEPAPEANPLRDRNRESSGSRSSSGPSRNAEVNSLISQAETLVEENRLVDARSIFNAALHHPRAGDAAAFIRQRMTELNDAIVFSTTVFEDDPWTERYTIKSGDRLSLIAPNYDVDWRFIARINQISRPERIRVGQQLKIIRGPFHAFIDKSQYRLDLYLGEPDSQGRRMYIRSLNVGLGEFDSTPTGAFVVRDDSKLINPPWTNPRTGEHFDADDPMNPIGERWIGLMGVDSTTRDLEGYGIHGTIDHGSIGQQRSMGCVRLLPDDVNLIYEVLMEEESTVFIRD